MQPLGGGPLGEQPLEHAPRDPDHAVVPADLDPELHGLPLGIPAGVLGVAKPPLRPVRRSRSRRLAAIPAADLSKKARRKAARERRSTAEVVGCERQF
jgi:hypothetical protein